MKKAKESVYEYYDFGFLLKENVFMTKVVQKYRLYNSIYEEPYAYMTQQEKKILLGDPTFKKRLWHLIDIEALTEIIVGVNPKNAKQVIKGYIPKDLPYARSTEYLPCLDKYYLELKGKLSPEAANIYNTLKDSTIDITDYQLAKSLVASCNRHGHPDQESYIEKHSKILKERIKDFNCNADMYVVEDLFGNRVHTMVSSIPQEVRKGFVNIDGIPTIEYDLHQSQMVILGNVLEDMCGVNSFSDNVKTDDVYLDFGNKNGILNRFEAKKFMFRALFDRVGSNADLMFKQAYPDVYPHIEDLKSKLLPQNPSWKWHSNLAFMLQQEESSIFRNLWNELHNQGIKFLTAHDSILVKENDGTLAKEIMNRSMELQIGNHAKINSTQDK